MNRTISRQWWLALLGLAWLATAGQAQTWERSPIKVNTNIRFDIDISISPDLNRPALPWYMYFPADPRLQPSPQTSPFPPFPAAFPPQAYPPVAPKVPAKLLSNTNVAQAPMPGSYWPSTNGYGSNVQPVGYVPSQAPSYWYRGR